MKKMLPVFLIFGGFFLLTNIPWIVALGCMLLGVVMLIEQWWPEKLGESKP